MKKYIEVNIPDGKYCMGCDYIFGDENYMECTLFPGGVKKSKYNHLEIPIYEKCHSCFEFSKESIESTLSYNGYTGSIEPSLEDNCFNGKILNVNDLFTYEGKTLKQLKANFEKIVRLYVKEKQRKD